jgi:hypothetical protein
MLASAAPAAAINPGGGRHRVEAQREATAAQSSQSTQRAQSARTAHSARNARNAASSANSQLDQELYRLRMCESHNNYSDNTGNGYYGAYQFALQTWQDLGMTGRPDQAAPAVQDYAAKVLHARAGWSPWPACSVKEGLT